jgi:hypothetical protein
MKKFKHSYKNHKNTMHFLLFSFNGIAKEVPSLYLGRGGFNQSSL